MESASGHLLGLPQEGWTWQAEFFNIKIGEEYPLWLVWVTDPVRDLILAYDVSEKEPTVDWLWNTLTRAMECSLVRDPYRPTELVVRRNQAWEPLRPKLEEIGIALVASDDLDPVDGVPELIEEVWHEWEKKHKRG